MFLVPPSHNKTNHVGTGAPRVPPSEAKSAAKRRSSTLSNNSVQPEPETQLSKHPLAPTQPAWYKRSVESSAWQPDFCISRKPSGIYYNRALKTSEINPGHGVLIRGQRSSKGFSVVSQNLHKIFFQVC